MKLRTLVKLCSLGFALLLMLFFVGCGSKNKDVDNIEESLKSLVEIANKQYPTMLDSTMRIDSSAVKGRTITYFCTMTEDDIFDAEILEEIGVPTIKENLKNNSELDFFRENNLSIQYIYFDNAGKKLYDFTLSTDDIK